MLMIDAKLCGMTLHEARNDGLVSWKTKFVLSSTLCCNLFPVTQRVCSARQSCTK